LTFLSEHDVVDPALTPMRKELVRISRRLTDLSTRSHDLEEIIQIQRRLDEIDASKNSIGIWEQEEDGSIPAGQVFNIRNTRIALQPYWISATVKPTT
jgi:hypothetical protein